MELHVLNHPLVEHKLTVLRDKNTPSSTFRELVSELVMLEAYEATRNLSVVAAPIETPVAPMTGKKLASPRPIIVPVLRAGLGTSTRPSTSRSWCARSTNVLTTSATSCRDSATPVTVSMA